MTCCPDYCGCTEADTGWPEGITSGRLVSETWNPSERIHVTSTVSMRLAEAAKGDAPPTKLEDVIPELYLSFQDIFSKESFDELPSRNSGIMPSTLSQDPSHSVQRSTQYPLLNRKNLMISSMKTYQAVTSVPQNCQWHLWSSLSRRRMGNYGSSRITKSLTR